MFLETVPPSYLRVWMTSPPPTLPEGLDPPLQHIHLQVIAIMLTIEKKNNNYKERSKIGVNLPCILLDIVIFGNLWQKTTVVYNTPH